MFIIILGGILVIKRFCHIDSEFDDSLDTSVAWPEQPVPRRCALILFPRRNREHGEGIEIVYNNFGMAATHVTTERYLVN